jgi:tetratricopeptide (TPR) repeat protein
MTEPQLFQSAIRHNQAGQLADAERIYRQILAKYPRHFDSLHLLGILAHQVRQHDAAIDLIGRAIACNDRVPECHYNMGLALAAAGRMQDAARSFGHAIALKGDYAEAHMNLGNAQMNLGHVDEAIASLERALALKPDVAELHYNIANVLAENGQLDRAVISYERALSLKPDYADAHNNLGTVQTGQGKYEEGLARDRRALALKPDLVQAHVNCGNALMAQGRLDDAAAALLEATARRPDYAEAHANLDRIYALQGKSNEAIARYRRALSIDPDLVAALVSVATLLLGLGDQVQAFEVVKRALRLRPSSEVKELFAHCVRNLEATSDSAEHRALVSQALAEGWGRPKEFARFATGLIKSVPKMAVCIARAKAAYPRASSRQELFGESGVAAVGKDSLLQLLLVSTRSQDVDLERVLMAARAELLEAAADELAAPADADEISFICALARQCFINEYIFSCGNEEMRRAEEFRDSVCARRSKRAMCRPPSGLRQSQPTFR